MATAVRLLSRVSWYRSLDVHVARYVRMTEAIQRRKSMSELNLQLFQATLTPVHVAEQLALQPRMGRLMSDQAAVGVPRPVMITPAHR